MSHPQRHAQDLHPRHRGHHPHVIEDDSRSILHWLLGLSTNPWLPDGIPTEPCSLLDGRRTLRRDLVSHLLRHVGFDGPDISPSSLCGQRTMPGGPFLALRTGFHGKPIILEREPGQKFLGFCLKFEPFALRYSPPRDFNQVMAPFSASPLDVQLLGLVSRLFLVANMCVPQIRTASRFCRIASLVQSCRLSGTRVSV